MKNIDDYTIKELIKYCEKHKSCMKCPLLKYFDIDVDKCSIFDIRMKRKYKR